MQIKFDIIIKNQSKSIIKFKTTKTKQNLKKSQSNNFIELFQTKLSSHEKFNSIKIFSNVNLIKSSIIFIAFIVTIKHTVTNSKSWTQIVNRKTVKKIQKINTTDIIKKIKFDEKTTWKNRWMIMISTTSINQIDCMKYQNKMNNIFKKINIHDVLIITTEKFKTKNFIVFTIIEKNTTKQFIKY